MNTRPRLWLQVHRALRTVIFARRIMRSDDEIGRALHELAVREVRSEDEIATDLLRAAITRRMAAEANLRRWQELTSRERDVVALTCLNLTNQEIAERLVISPETVKTHIRNVLYKFNLRRKSDLRQLLADWDFSAWAGEETRTGDG